MSKKVSEAHPGIKALAKKAPEVVQKMGYSMQMNKPKTNNANNFSNQDEMQMAKSSIYMMGKNSELAGVVLPGTDKSGEGKLNIEDFNQQSAEIKKNISAAKSAFDKSITSDSLTKVIHEGKPSEIDLLKYEKARDMGDYITKNYGNSFKTLDLFKDHDRSFRSSSGIYNPKNLK